MHRIILLFLFLPLLSYAEKEPTCVFTVGHASITGNTPFIKPQWFIVSGKAKLELHESHIEAKFFDDRLDGEISHLLSGQLTYTIDTKDHKAGHLDMMLRTFSTDTGDEKLGGSYILARDTGVPGAWIQSLVVHSASSFVGVNCYANNKT